MLVGLSGDALVNEVKRLTGGEGAHVVYDSVGKVTFQDSTRLLRVNGHLVSYGNASGKVGAGGPACSRLRAYLFFPYSGKENAGSQVPGEQPGKEWQGLPATRLEKQQEVCLQSREAPSGGECVTATYST